MTLQKCNLFDFVKVLTSSYDISVFDYLFLTFFIILITEFWKFSIKFINGIIIDTHSIYLQIYWTIIKGADLNKYTFSLLNIEWKVYLFKSAPFIKWKDDQWMRYHLNNTNVTLVWTLCNLDGLSNEFLVSSKASTSPTSASTSSHPHVSTSFSTLAGMCRTGQPGTHESCPIKRQQVVIKLSYLVWIHTNKVTMCLSVCQ